MTHMIRTLKRSSLTVSKHIGLTSWLAQSSWRRQRLMILCYHGVSLDDEHQWHSGLYVSQAQLERRLTLLRRNRCTVLPLDEAIQRLYANDLPDRAVALTFDDGYYDFMARAWPVVKSFGFPATVYLTTGRVDHNTPMVHLLVSYGLWKARDRVLDGTGIRGLSGRYVLESPHERQRAVNDLMRVLSTIDIRFKDPIGRATLERVGLDYEALARRRLLTLLAPGEVSALAAEGVDFQLHTHLHRTPEDADEFVRDVLYNRMRLDALTGKRPSHLCYPSGIYRMSYLPALANEGIVSATTCDPGLASPTSNPLLLPRFVDTMLATDVEFEAWVLGLASCLPRRTIRAHAAIH
jgi:peptidoglycan/xylan/chitin deacetylase (PgdA/CDA1 family)